MKLVVGNERKFLVQEALDMLFYGEIRYFICFLRKTCDKLVCSHSFAHTVIEMYLVVFLQVFFFVKSDLKHTLKNSLADSNQAVK